MPNRRITENPQATVPALADIIPLVVNVATAPETRWVTIEDVLGLAGLPVDAVAADLAVHIADTTAVHGIADTSKIIIKNPGTSQVIQPTANVIPLIVKTKAAQTVDGFQVVNSSGSQYFRVKPDDQEGGLVHVARTFTAPPTSGYYAAFRSQLKSKGPRTQGNRTIGFWAGVTDDSSVVTKTISTITNSGGLIRVTTSAAHTFATGDWVGIWGVGGTTEANNTWQVTVISSTVFDLQGSTHSHAYTSGGQVTSAGMGTGLVVEVTPVVDRTGMPGSANANADDINGITVQNTGTKKATDAVYIAKSPSVTGSAWFSGFAVSASVDRAFVVGGGETYDIGLDLSPATTMTTAAILIGNNHSVSARKADGTVQEIWRLDGSNNLQIGKITTFTPNLLFNGTNVGMTVALRDGKALKIGRLVRFYIRITLTAKGSSTGTATVSGLPYTSDAQIQAAEWAYGAAMASITGGLHARIASSGTGITLSQWGSTGSVDLDQTNFGNSSDFILSGSYISAT